MEQTVAQKMQSQLQEKLEDAFESVVNQKNEFYKNNPQKIPEKSTINALISSASLANSAISGGSSLIPGPWGMLAVVPELVVVIRNQIALIYDIAAANGKKDLMTKELAAMVFASSMGTGVGGLVAVHGGQYLVKRTSLQVFQKIVVILGGKITQQALKSAVSKWLPGVGALAMAAWTNYMTRQIGKKANEIFSSEIKFEDSIADIELIRPVEEEIVEGGETAKMNFYKIKILVNLMKIDGKTTEEESIFISPLIENSDVSVEDKINLIECISNADRTLDGINIIAASPIDSISLVTDMIALAKVDNQFHITEKLYIKQIGKLLNFSDSDVNELIDA
jgi:uncharacterized protein (DUF697 family)/uncharacterized tellurite resistance protein B-like protein